MAIDIDTPESPGWWMNVLWQMLRAEQPRYNKLEAIRRGNPPLPANLPKSLKAATREMIEMSEYNVADLIVQAMVERLAVRALRTAVAADENGDSVALEIWENANMPFILTDVFRAMAGMSIGYIALAIDDEGNPVATYEDPRQMISVQDPINPVITRAAFKVFHDPLAQRDYAILWLPGEKWVASNPAKGKTARKGVDGVKRVPVAFNAQQFTMHPVEGDDDAEDFVGMKSETYSTKEVFVYPFENRDGVSEFEFHMKHLRAINHLILQGIVTATFQAFKQRALQVKNGEELPDVDPETGEPIDYDNLLSADPGALWLLPLGAEIWESGQVDMTGIAQMVKDAIQRLFSVTRTPFSMGSSDAVNQSAEGAQLSREGLVFKALDRRDAIATPRLRRVAAALFRLAGDNERADASKIIIDWTPVERYSLSEKAQADSQAVSLPDEQKWRQIWQMTPDEITVAIAQKSAQLLRMAALAGAGIPAPEPPAPAPAPTTRPATGAQPVT